MDAWSLDRFRRALAAAITRRGWLQLPALLALAAPPAWSLSQRDALAGNKGKKKKRKKKKKKKKRKQRNRALAGGDPSLDSEEYVFLDLINAHRGNNGLAGLAPNALLGAAADGHSQDMANRNYFDHDTPEGVTPEQRIENQGYTGWTAVGENIFAGDQSAQEAFINWQNSPGHNENMLAPDFTEIGIGRAFNAGSDYGWYWTTTFGSR